MIDVAEGVLVATSRVVSTTSTVLYRDGEAQLIGLAWMPDEFDGPADELDPRATCSAISSCRFPSSPTPGASRATHASRMRGWWMSMST
jgi:hypothetical protein